MTFITISFFLLGEWIAGAKIGWMPVYAGGPEAVLECSRMQVAYKNTNLEDPANGTPIQYNCLYFDTFH